MVRSFRHKGLKQFFEKGAITGIQPAHRKKLRLQLAALDTALTIEDMNVPGYRLHRLKGKRQGYWAVDVSGSWRLTFKFEGGHVQDLNYEDYH